MMARRSIFTDRSGEVTNAISKVEKFFNIVLNLVLSPVLNLRLRTRQTSQILEPIKSKTDIEIQYNKWLSAITDYEATRQVWEEREITTEQEGKIFEPALVCRGVIEATLFNQVCGSPSDLVITINIRACYDWIRDVENSSVAMQAKQLLVSDYKVVT